MKISGITVCVDYADHLAKSLPTWMTTLDSLVVVTAERDTSTIDLCRKWGVAHLTTDVFYANGASFNQGAAVNLGSNYVPIGDWVLFFDSDIIPPLSWRDSLENVKPDTLYGARRYVGNRNNIIPDPCPAGYFMLFHGENHPAKRRPLVDTCWPHAGNWDSCFMMRFPLRQFLPLEVEHVGEPGKNWFGVGNEHKIAEMRAERERVGGWEHERLTH